MNDDEIKRYMANLKGDQGNKSDEENASNTKTRITRGGELNHDDIDFDLINPMAADKTHLEYDEGDLPLSIKTDAIINKKAIDLDKLEIIKVP